MRILKRKWWLVASIFFAFFLCGLPIINGYRAYIRPLNIPHDTLIYVPKGAGYLQLTQHLTKEGYYTPTRGMNLLLRILSPTIKWGEYEIPAKASLKIILQVIDDGKQHQRLITIPEGSTSKDICNALDEATWLEGSCPEKIPEGSILPNTYATQHSELKESLIQRWQAQANDALNKAWEQRSSGLPLNSPQELLTLASIVEKETSIDVERPVVAAVFLNRLKKGMRLQADPTVLYGIRHLINPAQNSLSRADLKAAPAQNPYNTYTIKGLPPTPICHPGIKSIQAVANPAPVKYLYFVADGTGGHVFSKTLQVHKQHHNKWRKIRKKMQSSTNGTNS